MSRSSEEKIMSKMADTRVLQRSEMGCCAAVGAVALLLDRPDRHAAASGRPNWLRSPTTARAVDRSTMPALERFQARDGT